MKIKDLITKLQQFDQDLDIVLAGYEGGYYEPERLRTIKIVTNVNKEWYYGPHEQDSKEYATYPENRKLTCVVLY